MIPVGDILSVEIIFKVGPNMKVYINDMYGLEIDSIPASDIDFSEEWEKPKQCKKASFNIKNYENRPIWSFVNKTTVDYFDWVVYSKNIREIRINLQNYQKRFFSVPWKPDSRGRNEYQFGEILDNGDLKICIENTD